MLIIAMTDSIHTARWIQQIGDQDWEVEVFPSILGGISHPELSRFKIHDNFLSETKAGQVVVKFGAIGKLLLALPDLVAVMGNKKRFHLRRLAKVVKRFKPDIIHTIEFQRAGYLMLDYLERNKKDFTWLATNWGSDIYYYGGQPGHKKKVRKILGNCDYYSCECQRDVCLAKQYGLKGTALPTFPNSGGFHLQQAQDLRSTPPSQRKIVLLKGYQNWSGRALIALKALEKCSRQMKNFELVIFSADESTIKLANRLAKKGVLKIRIIPKRTPHQEILALQAKSRVSIGLSISDAISTSMLEAMVMGSFPIQSNTACADEWIEDGVSGFIVVPDDINALVKRIKTALRDDVLVDNAWKINFKTARQRLDQKIIEKKTIAMYKQVYGKDKDAS